MVAVGSEEVRTNWGTSLDKAHSGQPLVINRHGRPYAVLVSYDQWMAQQEKHLAMLKHLADAPDSEFISHEEVMKGLQ